MARCVRSGAKECYQAAGHFVDRGRDFLYLANALSALYPKGSEEKPLLDAMLPAVSR